MRSSRLILASILTLLVGIIAVTHLRPANSFIGNKLLGSKLCVVGCGRGPLGIAPLGDALNWTGNNVFGPALGIENAGNRVVDRADAKLAEKLEKLDTVLKGRVDQLNVVLADRTKALDALASDKLDDLNLIAQDSIDSLDAVLREQLREGERVLERRFASLDIIGIKQQAALELLAHRLIVIACVLAFLTFVVIRVWRERAAHIFDLKRSVPRYLGLSLLGTAALVGLYFLLPTQYNLRDIEKNLVDDYRGAVSNLEFPAAGYYATKLQALDPENHQYSAFMDKAMVLTDVFMRPSSYKSTDGLAQLEQQVVRALKRVPD